MGIGEECQCTEERRAVDSGQSCLQVSEAEGIAESVAHLAPDKQSYCRQSYSCIVKDLFVRDVKMFHHIFLVSAAKIQKKIVPLHQKTDNNMTQEERTQLEERIVDVLKTVYDPEIPVNIYDLGMIYKIDVQDDGSLDMDMTFTAPNCPAADFILEDVRSKVESVEGITTANVNLVFEPAWDQSMMSEEARVELGFD